MPVPPLAVKSINFNGVEKEIFASILRVATAEDKEASMSAGVALDYSATYLVVEFTYGKTDYRGLWKQDECLLL